MPAAAAAQRAPNGQLHGRKKGEAQPKDPCPGCGTMVTRGRPGKQHIPGADGKRPCEAKAVKRAAEASMPPVDRGQSTVDYSFGAYEDLDALEKAAAGDASGPEDPGSAGPAPAGGGAPQEGVTLADLSQLADPMVVWGGAADFCNNVQQSMVPAPSTKWEVKMTPAKAEALQRGLFLILPKVLLNPYAFFAFGIFFTFGLPMLGAWGESRKLAAAQRKAAAPEGVKPSGSSPAPATA